jgi:hypothetical protein
MTKKPVYCLGLSTIRRVAKDGQLKTKHVDFVAADDLFHADVYIAGKSPRPKRKKAR